MSNYIPSDKILKKYANVLIKYALNSGKGLKKDEVVFVQVPESAKPILNPLVNSILESGGHPIVQYLPEKFERNFFDNASMKQIEYMPKDYLLARVDEADHFVRMIATDDKHELEGVDTKKIMAQRKAGKFYLDARRDKEYAGNLTWTLGLYGTEDMAKEANLSLEKYWKQIIKACYLDKDDPISEWKKIAKEQKRIIKRLNNLKIEYVKVEGKDVDLKIKIGKKRAWVGGSGRNIPSFEIFTSPDWRETKGWVKFSEPLYRYGSLIKGVELKFEEGLVVESSADKNEKLLKEMLKVENADKVGEFSLTDKRFSRITEFMAETLFDENVGGKYGNFHIAVGSAYKDCYDGDPKEIEKEEWEKLGYNIDTVIHTDIVSTTDRTVTAELKSGEKKVIYKDGKFTV